VIGADWAAIAIAPTLTSEIARSGRMVISLSI
jgi:hypothetical protein